MMGCMGAAALCGLPPAAAVVATAVNMFDINTCTGGAGSSFDTASGTITWTSRTSVAWTPPVPLEANTTYSCTVTSSRTGSPSGSPRLFLGSSSFLLTISTTQTFTITTGAGDVGGSLSFLPSQTSFNGGTMSATAITIIKQ